ncbi:MAG: hypothetical protein KDD44_04200 [Bdellovibrionales bacterium]|nr:hypothetical protein [Bdellovibrionales bacterium]
MGLFGKKRTYVQPVIDTRIKTWSLAFYLSIPILAAFSGLLLISLVSLLRLGVADSDKWLLFTWGLVLSASVLGTSSITTIRTLIHELRHAAVVILTGNELRELKVYRDIGHVLYYIRHSRRRLAPYIILAPYFFPLLSLPALIAACILEHDYPILMSAILGTTLGSDLLIAIADLHPWQSDLRRIFGGTVPTMSFISLANICWVLICLLWITSGTNAFLFTAYRLLALLQALV